MARSSSAYGILVGLCLLLLVGLTTWFAWVGDDGFIAFRYGRNLADGFGLVFNPTDAVPVEGFTALAWVLVVAVVEWIGIEVVGATRILEIATAVGLAWYVSRVALRGSLGVGPVGAAIALLVLVTSPGIVIWSTGGLGTILFALPIFACAERLLSAGLKDEGSLVGLCLAAGLATFVRFDGVYFAGVVLLSGVIAALLAGNRRLLVVSLIGSLVAGVAVGLQSLWRWLYFGDLVPNTVHAKGGVSAKTLERGLDYVVSNWMTVPLLFVALGLAIGYAWRLRRTEPATVVIAGILIGTTLFGILVGGDFMPMGRFFVPALPFVALVVGRACRDLLATRGQASVACATVAALVLSVPALFDVSLFPHDLREAHTFRWGGREFESEVRFHEGVVSRAKEWGLFGKVLALHTKPEDSFVRSAVGAISYYSNLTIYDRLGLTDREAALNTIHDPENMTMPGHDCKVPEGFFDGRNPTWVEGILVYGEGPGTDLFQRAKAGHEAGTGDFFRFGPKDGFPDQGIIILERGPQN